MAQLLPCDLPLIPANAGIQAGCTFVESDVWVPAFAGTNG
jgi:hypothetical protein